MGYQEKKAHPIVICNSLELADIMIIIRRDAREAYHGSGHESSCLSIIFHDDIHPWKQDRCDRRGQSKKEVGSDCEHELVPSNGGVMRRTYNAIHLECPKLGDRYCRTVIWHTQQ